MRGDVWFDKAKFVSRGSKGKSGKYKTKEPAYWDKYPRYKRVGIAKNTYR